MKYLVLSVGFLFVLPHFTMAEQGTKEKQEETAPSKTGKQKANKSEKKPAKAAEEAKTAKKVVRENGLEIEDIKVGSGPEAREGNRIRVHYRGTLINGKEFDSNFSDANPEPFILDKGHLIAEIGRAHV